MYFDLTAIDRRCDEQFHRCVRTALETSPERYPSLAEVAGGLCVSARTLKRRLRKRGLSYRRLLDEVRLSRGAQLLAQPGLSLETIALRTGYSSGANFSRAFRRWAGVAPGRFRQQQRPHAAPGGEAPRLI